MTSTSYSAKAREMAAVIRCLDWSKTDFICKEIEQQVLQALTTIGNEREAIGYEKGKEEAAKICKHKAMHELMADDTAAGVARAKPWFNMEQAIRNLPLLPKEK
jgi:hypothetical protein